MTNALRASAAAAVVALVSIATAGAGPASAADPYADVARNIVPSGQYGSAPTPPGADEQARMYDALTPKLDRVTNRDLATDFKSERLGTGDDGPYTDLAVPRRGVTVRLDRFGVPHVKATDRDGLTWATGYLILRDRNLLFEQARGAARLAALSAPNVSAFSLVRSLRPFTPSAQTERIVARQTDVLRRTAKGRLLLADIDVYVDGLNAGRRAFSPRAATYTRNDVYAANALLGQIFGEGGGREAENAGLLADLRVKLGARRGMQAFDDLKSHRDPEHPATLERRFAYQGRPSTADGRVPRGSVALDRGSYRPELPAGEAAARREPGGPHASNFLAVGAKASATGRPLFVGGPQVGYFYPGLTYEVDLKAPGIQARGVTAPGFPGNVLIGRAQDYAWSLTSAGSDLIDTYSVELCGGSSTRYRYRGRCRSMGRIDAGELGGERLSFRTTVHGPVTGYARANGRRVALTQKRASEGRDAEFQTVFRDLTLGKARDTQRFYDIAAQSPFTFNVGYVNSRDAAMYSAGRLPLRPRDVDPRLPTRGDGSRNWTGFLAPKDRPKGRARDDGWLVNWNDLPARGFPASDANYGQGAVQRVELLDGNLRRQRRLGGGRLTLARVTGAMNLAATQDLRAVRLTPVLRRVLRRADAPSARASAMVAELERWRRAGGSRVDADGDGRIDQAGAAVIDAISQPMTDAAFRPRLGGRASDAFTALAGRGSTPGSGFTGGRLPQLFKDLRTVAGERVRGRYALSYCGLGSAERCARDLWRAIDAAGARVAAEQGDDPSAWRASATAERISFAPGLLTTRIAYTNRPSGIQQVISFRSGRSTR